MPANLRLRAALAVVAVVVALAGAWVLGRATRPSDTVSAGQSQPPVSLSASPPVSSSAPPPSTSPSNTPSPSSTTPHSAVEAGRTSDFGYFTASKTTGGFVHLSFDRADLFTGAAANSYAAKHHMQTPVPNDYVIVNDSRKLRDLVLSPDVKITGIVLLASSLDGKPVPVTLADFLAKIKKDHTIPFTITFDKDLLVTKVDEHFFRDQAMTSRSSRAVSEGVLPTRTPTASSASCLACAVPDEPDTIAPAWPMVLPSGAVKPAT